MGQAMSLDDFYAQVAASVAPLPPVWQHRIAAHAANSRSGTSTLVALLERDDLDAEVFEMLAENRTAAVRVAWLSRQPDDVALFARLVKSETRKSVLTTIAQADIPDSAFQLVVDRADGPDLVLTVLETGRCDAATARELVGRIVDCSTLTNYPFQERLDALDQADLFRVIVEGTKLAAVVACYGGKVANVDLTLARAVIDNVIEPRLAGGAIYTSDLDEIIGALDRLVTNGNIDDDATSAILEVAERLRAQRGRPVNKRSTDFTGSRLDQLIARCTPELPEAVAKAQSGDPVLAAEALQELREHAYKPSVTMASSRAAKAILGAIITSDDVYSDELRTEAVRLAANGRLSTTFLCRLHGKQPFRVTPELAAAMLCRSTGGDGSAELVRLSTDPDLAVELVVTHFPVPIWSVQSLWDADLMSDRHIDLLARSLRPDVFFRSGFERNPSLQQAVLGRALELGAAALGTSDDAWEFLEVCFGKNEDLTLVDVMDIASTAAPSAA